MHEVDRVRYATTRSHRTLDTDGADIGAAHDVAGGLVSTPPASVGPPMLRPLSADGARLRRGVFLDRDGRRRFGVEQADDLAVAGRRHGLRPNSIHIGYKAEAEGVKVELVDEHSTSKTCPHCGQRHNPRGRNFFCPTFGIQTHRDVVGQINILSRFLEGDVGRLPAPADVKYRIPRNVRVLRSCAGHGPGPCPVAREQSRGAAPL
jgi:Putative transposase DNA-binding domain